MQSNVTRKPVPTRIPILFISLFAAMLIGLWAVGYAQAIPFVIPFTLIIGGPLMNFLTYEIHDQKEQSVRTQNPALPQPRPDITNEENAPHTA